MVLETCVRPLPLPLTIYEFLCRKRKVEETGELTLEDHRVGLSPGLKGT